VTGDYRFSPTPVHERLNSAENRGGDANGLTTGS
jgi:hypothetical protein